MRRREFLAAAGAGVALSTFPLRWTHGAFSAPKKILYFTRSAGFEHSVVARKGGELAFSEKILIQWGKEVNVEVVCSKDGGVFDGDLDQFDAFAFYATGDWTKPVDRPNEPPATESGVKRLLEAIAAGKGVIGFHAANDAFHSRGNEISPFIKMIGGEFASHGRQQEATMRVVSPKFPGCEKLGDSFRMMEEWYAMKNLADDLHVVDDDPAAEAAESDQVEEQRRLGAGDEAGEIDLDRDRRAQREHAAVAIGESRDRHAV
ncbi:MAG TPA: ThuA domain-containing protein, partial [Thermogutta sp.]|nr:ThuA domain-containing protein [Thermogutta sp.]